MGNVKKRISSKEKNYLFTNDGIGMVWQGMMGLGIWRIVWLS